jgi:hypothetical protein
MKTESILIRVSPEEKEAFQRVSEISGVALSAWIRERLRRYAARELQEAHEEIPFLRKGGRNGTNRE